MRAKSEAAARLAADRYLEHNPFMRRRPLLNEVFYLRPHEALDQIVLPVLIVLTIMLLNASTFFLRVMAAAWALRVSKADKPYSFISVCCGLCAAFCGIVVFLTKL